MPSDTPVPLWRRLAAAAYDLLVLVAVWMLVAALVLAAFHGEVDVARQPPLYHAVLQVSLLAATALYFAVSWSRGGQTIGMRAWRVRVVGADGRSPAFLRALARFGVAIASTLVVGLGFAWCLVDRRRRTWHDIASSTSLVHVPPR